MRLRQRGAFWVVLLLIAIVALFAGSQVWLSYGAKPSSGVQISVNMEVAPGPATNFQVFLGDRPTGKWMPIIELPDSVTQFEEERYEPLHLDDDTTRPPTFDLRAWLEEGFPEATILELGTPVAVAADAEGAGMTGSVTEVRLRRGDVSLDPFWFVTFSPEGSSELWGTIARARAGTFIETSSWTASARPMLWWRNHFMLRREICFGVEIFATFEENEPGAVYWLDRVGALDPALPEGAVPPPRETQTLSSENGGSPR